MKELHRKYLLAALLLVCDERAKVTTDLGTHRTWENLRENFVRKNQMALNSWAGDMFANVFNKMGIPREYYEEFRAEYFLPEYED